MAEPSSSVCAICYGPNKDARLLACLHSFCKTCLDDLDMRSGHEGEISCPLCRWKTRLSETGVSGLAKDLVATSLSCDCHTCTDEGGDAKPELFCSQCDASFCKDHGVAHLLANCGHNVKLFAKESEGHPTAHKNTTSRRCPDHDLPLVYFCKQCDTAVCGECTALGQHHNHDPIATVKEIVNDLKHLVHRKIDIFKTVRLRGVQRALSAVDEVSTQLSSRADDVRAKTLSFRKSVIDAVELVFEQKLAEIDDLEETRLKHLAAQRDKLKLHADGLKSVIRYEEKVFEKDAQTEDMRDVLLAVDMRAEDLQKEYVEKEPVEHARFDFKKIDEEEMVKKVSELVGNVLPCNASAKHSFVEGQTRKTCPAGAAVSFTVVAKDNKGRRLSKGGDAITAELCQKVAEVRPRPTVNVLDKKNGTYQISISTEHKSGEYSFDVFVNNVKLEEHCSITFLTNMTFDPSECQPESTISEDRLTVIHTGKSNMRSSVLSSDGMHTGEHVWQVRMTKAYLMSVRLGVAEKPGFTDAEDNCQLSYSWTGRGNQQILGKSRKRLTFWKKNDVLQLHLNCTQHTLSIKNLRSGETDTIRNLPPTELFAHFGTFYKGDTLTLVQ